MKNIFFTIWILFFLVSCKCNSQPRTVVLLDDGWHFMNEEVENAQLPSTSTEGWETVTVPHDWAISGEFDRNIDIQEVIVKEDGEKVPQLRTGRTGGLPHIGIGWYRKELEIASNFKGERVILEFDGAMSHAQVYLNGAFIGEWPYGYSSFSFDVTEQVNFGGRNTLAVRLENKPYSSRWYPGAGIYRNVRMVMANPVHVKHWGTYITTPDLENGKGSVHINTSVENKSGEPKQVTVETQIFAADNNLQALAQNQIEVNGEFNLEQDLLVNAPQLWSVDNPTLYKAITIIKDGDAILDQYETPFGFRYFEFTNNKGFLLNGEQIKLNGVCLHHDLGPLGAAVNLSSLRHRYKLLKEMGCNAIRTSHNPPTPEMLELADEMGFVVIDEAFDEWKYAKTENGYNTLWDKWAEKDMTALIHRDRNHPSVIMWSIGNEIREQGVEGGEVYCQFLVDICKREDPIRPTTAGFNNWWGAIKNGFGEIVDVPGWNYKPQYYNFIHNKFPHWKMYGSETASTVSSRGEYFFPTQEKVMYTREPFHSSSFDMEFPTWATSPDREFAAQDSFKFMAGEFVWTGFDYLGEPTPYNVQWPARSSYFGIIDLCGIPKDRYYLYQTKWTDKEVLHLLPHWNWEEGQDVTVHCYTSFDKGELFVNGKSMGVRQKDPENLYSTYRWVWDNIVYEPGEIKVVALDKNNKPVKETVIKTAGKPHTIVLEADRTEILADGKELAFVTVSVVDEKGVPCPRANDLINFSIAGEGALKAVGNGDPTSLESFVKPYRKLFNGKCMAIIQSAKKAGQFTVSAEGEGLKPAQLVIKTRK